MRLNLKFQDDPASSDAFVIYTDNVASFGFDKSLDALKILNTDFTVPNLYALLPGDQKLSIDALPSELEMPAVIPLGVKTNREGTLSFSLSALDPWFSQFELYFHDEWTGAQERLTEDFEYTVQLEAGEYHGRFSIGLLEIETVITDIDTVITDIQEPKQPAELFTAYPSFGLIKARIFDIQGHSGVISLYNLSGRMIFNQVIPATGDYEFQAPDTPGLYIVTYVSGSRAGSIKLFIGKS